jgi:hypothetical protein
MAFNIFGKQEAGTKYAWLVISLSGRNNGLEKLPINLK